MISEVIAMMAIAPALRKEGIKNLPERTLRCFVAGAVVEDKDYAGL